LTSKDLGKNDLQIYVPFVGHTCVISCHGLGRVGHIVRPSERPVRKGKTSFVTRSFVTPRNWPYDQDGNVIETIDPRGKDSFKTYDADNQLTSATDADGRRRAVAGRHIFRPRLPPSPPIG
jgi:YD repeat-containing protein